MARAVQRPQSSCVFDGVQKQQEQHVATVKYQGPDVQGGRPLVALKTTES